MIVSVDSLSPPLFPPRLSTIVESQDVAEALRLIRDAMLSYAIDPLTGRIDMDLVTTGKSSALRERQAELKRQVKSMLTTKGHTSIEFSTLLAEMNAQSSIVSSRRCGGGGERSWVVVPPPHQACHWGVY